MLPLLLLLQTLAVAQHVDPFAFLQPTVTITADDRKHLDRGEPIAHVLAARGLETAVVVAVPVRIDGNRLVAWIREIDQLKRSSYVLAIHRFSNPPRLQDLEALALEDSDLDEIRTCHPGACGVKLSAEEMRVLQQAAADGGSEWRDAVQRRFRQVMLDRVDAYLAAGRVEPYQNHTERVWPAEEFASLVAHSGFLLDHAPRFAASLRAPRPAEGVESFLYWSKERLARKAVISITDVNILRGRDSGEPDVLIAGKEVFATHYINASLGITALLRGQAGANYLVYVNRSEVDALGGFFGGLARFVIERRLKAESVGVLEGLRRRLESGEPTTH